MSKVWKGLVVVAIILALLTLLTNLVVPFEDPLSRGTSAGVYRAPGGDKLVIQSNGQVWVTPGATVSLGGSTFADNSTFNDAVVIQATPAATATPQLAIVDKGLGVPLEVRNASATPQVVVDGSYNLSIVTGGLDVTAGATTLEALSVGAAGTGADVYFYSDTSGDHLLWDASEEALTIIGTNGQDALNIDDGNVDIADNVAVSGAVTLDQTNGAGAGANPFDYTATLGIMDGSDTFTLFDVNITNVDHTGSNNSIAVLDIGTITGDNEATEAGIVFGAGWDFDMDAATSLDIGVNSVNVIVVKNPAAIDGGTTTELVEVSGTTPADTSGTNTHNFLTVDAAIGNASGGTNNVRGVQIDGIAGDAQVTETGINIGDGWDVGLAVADEVDLTNTNAAGGSADALDITLTTGVMDGSDDYTAIDVNITSANHGSTGNTITGIDLDLAAADADATETAIDIADADWDTGIKGIVNQEHIMLPSVFTTTLAFGTATGSIATVGDGEIWIVHGIWIQVTSNFNCTGDDCTLVVGDGNDADGFCVLADAELQAADTEATGFAAGWQCMSAATRGVYFDEAAASTWTGGFVYAPSGAAETIDYAIGGTDPAAGAANVYILYTRVK